MRYPERHVHFDFFEGRRDEARNHCGHLPDEGERALWHALMALGWGTAAEADHALEDLVARAGPRDPSSVADAYAWRGDADRAFAWLERDHEQRVGLSDVKADPLLRKIRGDPRHTALLKKMNLPVD